jgi:hypothetical protein
MKAAKSFIGVFEGHKPRRSRANSVPFRSINSIRFALHPGEVESLRCEITVRCVGAGVCGFDDGVK